MPFANLEPRHSFQKKGSFTNLIVTKWAFTFLLHCVNRYNKIRSVGVFLFTDAIECAGFSQFY